MYLNANKSREVQYKFNNYALCIKEDLLNQIINKESKSRFYFEQRFNELLVKYLDTVNTLNYNNTCSNFIHDIYELTPIDDTI